MVSPKIGERLARYLVGTNPERQAVNRHVASRFGRFQRQDP